MEAQVESASSVLNEDMCAKYPFLTCRLMWLHGESVNTENTMIWDLIKTVM